MPNILDLKTETWDLTIWTRDNKKPRSMLIKVLKERNGGNRVILPKNYITFSSPHTGEILVNDEALSDKFESIFTYTLDEPLFYENKNYEFDFTFNSEAIPDVENPIEHISKNVEDSFRTIKDTVRGTINFKNNVGLFSFTLVYHKKSNVIKEVITFNVYPVKMDMISDLNMINQEIDAIYPLWRFSFLQKTEHAFSRSKKPHEDFELLWIAQFKSLSKKFCDAIKIIYNSPHTRLIKKEYKVKADKLSGRLSTRLEEKVKENIVAKNFHKKYKIERSVLSFDTPENRFVKMVLNYSINRLSKFHSIVHNKYRLNDSGLSDTFFKQMNDLILPYMKLSKIPTFKDISDFDGLKCESLVLHNRLGYSTVYRVWQELKLYLDSFGYDANISLKSVEELYEIWCFIELRNILITGLGFTDESTKIPLKTKKLEKSISGRSSRFKFTREDGTKAILIHEPIFSYMEAEKRKQERIYSWTTPQKPDILLEITLHDNSKFMWVFDAKYRIDINENSGSWPKGNVDLIPADAINQMHRYRDSLIYLTKANEDKTLEKNRPIVGAFALYPGWFDQNDIEENPYYESNMEIGIGGFALLPGQNNNWIKSFLIETIGTTKNEEGFKVTNSDFLYLEESLRIKPYGLQTYRYKDLVLLASVPFDKDDKYKRKFNDGTAGYYHIPVKPNNKYMLSKDIIREISYCSVIVKEGIKERQTKYIYRIVKAEIMNRSDITMDQAGDRFPSFNSDYYWLLTLGSPIPIDKPLESKFRRDFHLRVAALDDVLEAQSWEDIKTVYSKYLC